MSIFLCSECTGVALYDDTPGLDFYDPEEAEEYKLNIIKGLTELGVLTWVGSPKGKPKYTSRDQCACCSTHLTGWAGEFKQTTGD